MTASQSNNNSFCHSVAPMMDWTDRHCRYFHRLISPNAILYTEMVTTGALIFGDKPSHLDFHEKEQPVILQLGGSDPEDLVKSAKIGSDWGYHAINLNCGCPSDRVQRGRFGACLMTEPELVATCMKAMQDAVSCDVTVKCRIGVDECDEEACLFTFIETLANKSATTTFIVHARKAWLKGLNPKENRTVPPLNYDLIKKAKEAFPELNIQLNGEINTLDKVINAKNAGLDGVMIGREAYQNPLFLHKVESMLYGEEALDIEPIIQKMHDYIQYMMRMPYPVRPKQITRHMMGLFKGQRGGKIWRQSLATFPDEPDILLRAYDSYLKASENDMSYELERAKT
ncbi:MAG: tRNA dihydrouridine(20/20a) synthase DusA [Micavibrio sp.]|nr:tRNA dihydrouridine(20/20a) synthase DusA [Micavibrio sp.]